METTLKLGDRVTVAGWGGVAFYLSSWPKRWEEEYAFLTLDEDDEPLWLETGDGEWVEDADSGWVNAVMVGDDTEHLVELDDCSPIADEEFCSECGQVGCGWGANA